MTTEEKFAEAYNVVAEMMERDKASPQKEAIELLLDTVLVFIEELKAQPTVSVAERSRSQDGGRHYHTTHNGHRYDVQADQSVANQQNVYQQNYTTHQYIYHEAQGMFRDIWVLPGGVSIDMNNVEYYDQAEAKLHLRSGKAIDIKPNQVQRLLSWYYMKGLLTPPKRSSKAAMHGGSDQGESLPERSRRPNDPVESAKIIAQIKADLRAPQP